MQNVSFVKLVLDMISLVLVFAIWLIFKYLVKPVRRAFLCSDLTLYHSKSEKNVFPSWLLTLCALIIPLIVIILSEVVRWFYLFRRKAAKFVYKVKLCSKNVNISEWIGNLYITIGIFLYATGVNVVLTNIGKVTVGRPRPHFISTCFNVSSYSSFCTSPNQWIMNYTCIGESSDVGKDNAQAYDIRQSFPSGHASSAFCGLIFLALYIRTAWNCRNRSLLPSVAQIICFALAAYIGITRITDNRHHPTDVISGAILGSFIAILAHRYMIHAIQRIESLTADDECTTY